MKLNLKINSMLLCLALFAACSSDDDGQVAQDSSQEQKQPQKTYPLSIEVAENPMVQEGEGGSSRRAPITTGSSLNSFNMDYVYDGAHKGTAEASNADGNWTTTAVWPEDAITSGETVYWYTSTKGGFYLTDDAYKKPYISFSTDEYSANQHDLLVAKASGTYTGTKVDDTNKLSFTFDHVCSALSLSVKKSSNLSDYTLSVSSIILKKVVKAGQYYYNETPSWVPSVNTADRSNYTLHSGGSITLGSGTSDYVQLNGNFVKGALDEPYLFLIPQTLTPWDPSDPTITSETTKSYLEIVCSITKGDSPVYSGTAYIPFGTTLEKGTKYDVKINIGWKSLYKADGTRVISKSE